MKCNTIIITIFVFILLSSFSTATVFNYNVTKLSTNWTTTATTGTTITWTNSTDVQSYNGVFATVVFNSSALTLTSTNLTGNNFGFAIPSNAVIQGVVVRASAKTSSASAPVIHINNVTLRNVTDLIPGATKFNTSTFTTSLVNYTVGSVSDTWTHTWTPAEINSASFGMLFIINRTNTATGRTASLDDIAITVYYSMDDGLNNTLKDCSGMGNNATNIGNVTWNATVNGTSFYNQSGKYLNITNKTAFASIKNYTISFWEKHAQQSGTYTQDIFVKKETAQKRVEATHSGTGSDCQLYFTTSDGTTDSDATSWEECQSFNTWNHVVLTCNSTQRILYFNNVVKTNDTVDCSQSFNNTGDLRIGSGLDTYYFNGTIKSFIIYNESLSVSQVGQLYLNQTPSGKLMLYLPFDNSSTCPAASNPAPIISNLKNESITNISVYISWTTDINGNSTVNYGTATTLGTYSVNVTQATAHNISITGLTNNTVYYYNVTSCTASNCSTNGTNNFTTTQNAAAIPIISNVQNTSITNISVQISWNTDINSNTSVNYGLSTTLGTKSETNDAVTSHSRTIGALTNNTIYYYNVTSCNANGCDQEGPYNFTTTQNPPASSCTTPTSGMTITTNTFLCAGTYFLNTVSTVITVTAPNINLTCNGTIIIGNGVGQGLMVGAVDNVNVTGCTFIKYELPVTTDYGSSFSPPTNITFQNVSAMNATGCLGNFYFPGARDLHLFNVTGNYAHNISGCSEPPHGCYISGDTGARDSVRAWVENSTFCYNDNSGLQLNAFDFVNDSKIINNVMCNNSDSGLNLDGTLRTNVSNNRIFNNKNRGISLGESSHSSAFFVKDTTMYNNTLYNNSGQEYLMFHEVNVKYLLNNYPDGFAVFDFRNDNLTGIYINESVTNLTIHYQDDHATSANTEIRYNYTGNKVMNITNSNWTAINQTLQYPYNDIKNLTSNATIATNINGYSIKLTANQFISIGAYTISYTCTCPNDISTDFVVNMSYNCTFTGNCKMKKLSLVGGPGNFTPTAGTFNMTGLLVNTVGKCQFIFNQSSGFRMLTR